MISYCSLAAVNSSSPILSVRLLAFADIEKLCCSALRNVYLIAHQAVGDRGGRETPTVFKGSCTAAAIHIRTEAGTAYICSNVVGTCGEEKEASNILLPHICSCIHLRSCCWQC
ncbi:hypothetical protein FKM82_024095 [Ascaphus truei]